MTASRSLMVSAPGKISLQTRPEPVPPDGEVLVAPKAVGLCGTDLEIISGAIGPEYVRYPVTIGHEWAGVVRSGQGLDGARVAVEGIIPCGECGHCRQGATNLCETYQEIGFTRDGAAADVVSVPRRLVHTLADHVTMEQAALIEPASVAMRAILRSKPEPGTSVLVIGDGSVALIAAHLLRLFSPRAIDVLGRREEQWRLADLAGARTFATDPSRLEAGYDLVIEAAGQPEAVLAALGMARRGGTVTLMGLSGEGRTAPIATDDIVNNDITLLGSFSYTSTAFATVVELLNSRQINPEFLITHRFPLERWEEAIATLSSASGERGKVLLTIG